MQKKNATRATVVIGATMALVMAGTAAVSAAPGDRDDRGSKRGKAGIGAQMGGVNMPGARGLARGMGGLRGIDEDFERRETTVQTADGVTSKRVEQGAVDSTAADALTFSLASGESVTVVIDGDTQLVAFEEKDVTVRGWSRTRLAPTEVEADAIEAGAEIVVWSDAEEGADFVASRVVVKPAEDADAAEADAEVADTDAEEAVEETVTEEAASTDA